MRKFYVKPDVVLVNISNQATIMDVSRFKPAENQRDIYVKDGVPTDVKLTKGTTVWDSFYDDEEEDF